MLPDATVPSLERALTLDILRGRYAPGSRLPSVRELAAKHDVTPATIQRVVARLETRGLVDARQGSGLHVRDPREAGDAGLLPLWLEATLDRPGDAARVLADLLELRRIVAARLLVRHRDTILARLPEVATLAEALGAAASGTLDAKREADLAFARALLVMTGNLTALAVFNTLARALEASPDLAEAMYAKPKENVRSMRLVMEALAQGGAQLEAALLEQMAEMDARTVSRFERRLSRGRAA